jgi:hypothetical protein
VRGDKQRGRRSKVRVGELGAHLCSHAFGVTVGLLGVKNREKVRNRGGITGIEGHVRQCSHIWDLGGVIMVMDSRMRVRLGRNII